MLHFVAIVKLPLTFYNFVLFLQLDRTFVWKTPTLGVDKTLAAI